MNEDQAFDWNNPEHVLSALEQAANKTVGEMADLEALDAPFGVAMCSVMRSQVVLMRTQAAMLRQGLKARAIRQQRVAVPQIIIPGNGTR